MMTVHDALQAWQAGEITSRRAMVLTDTANLVELYALAEACDVEIRFALSDPERQAVKVVAAAIDRIFLREEQELDVGLKSSRSRLCCWIPVP